MQSFAKVLIVVGSLIVASGILMLVLGRLGLGSLPGDIAITKGRTRFYFPIATSIVISVLLTVLLNIFMRSR